MHLTTQWNLTVNMMNAEYKQLFHSVKYTVLWIHPNSVYIWLCPYGRPSRFLNIKRQLQIIICSHHHRFKRYCSLYHSPHMPIWDVFRRARCLPTLQLDDHKKTFVHLGLLLWGSLTSLRRLLTDNTGTPMPQLTWEGKMRPLVAHESNKVRRTWLFTAFTSVSKSLPMLAMLVTFKQSGAVFLILGCLTLGRSEADKLISLPACVFTRLLLTSAISWGCSWWWMYTSLFIFTGEVKHKTGHVTATQKPPCDFTLHCLRLLLFLCLFWFHWHVYSAFM